MKAGEIITVFNTLHEQYRHMGLPTDLIDAQTDFTIFNLNNVIGDALPFKSPVHRLNFFVFNFIKYGSGHYTIDEQTFGLCPGTVYFTNPGHYRSYEWLTADEVYLITLSESFLKENVHADIFEEFPFLLTEAFEDRGHYGLDKSQAKAVRAALQSCSFAIGATTSKIFQARSLSTIGKSNPDLREPSGFWFSLLNFSESKSPAIGLQAIKSIFSSPSKGTISRSISWPVTEYTERQSVMNIQLQIVTKKNINII